MSDDKKNSEHYGSLEAAIKMKDPASIDSSYLIAFKYEYCPQKIDVLIHTEEFTALCPWTSLPDSGELSIRYTPSNQCIELKSLKFYLLSYRDVGIVQEHAASQILKDLVALVSPHSMEITLDYRIRGGVHTIVRAKHGSLDE